jgi:hypothetical protein
MDSTSPTKNSAKTDSEREDADCGDEEIPEGSDDSDSETLNSSVTGDPAATIYGGNIAAACEATNAVAKSMTAEERLERRRTRNRLNARRNREIRRREEKLQEEKEALRRENETLRREKSALENEVRELREVVRQLPIVASHATRLPTLPVSVYTPYDSILRQAGLFQQASAAAQGLSGLQTSIFHQLSHPSAPMLFHPSMLPPDHRSPHSLNRLNESIQSSLSGMIFPHPRDAQALLYAMHRQDANPLGGVDRRTPPQPPGRVASTAEEAKESPANSTGRPRKKAKSTPKAKDSPQIDDKTTRK